MFTHFSCILKKKVLFLILLSCRQKQQITIIGDTNLSDYSCFSNSEQKQDGTSGDQDLSNMPKYLAQAPWYLPKGEVGCNFN